MLIESVGNRFRQGAKGMVWDWDPLKTLSPVC